MRNLILTLIIFGIALHLAWYPASAAIMNLLLNHNVSGGIGSGPPACTNSLDFSQACNSQYFPVVFR